MLSNRCLPAIHRQTASPSNKNNIRSNDLNQPGSLGIDRRNRPGKTDLIRLIFLYLAEYLFTMHRDLLRGIDSESDLITFIAKNSNLDVVTNADGLSMFPCQNQHAPTLSVAADSIGIKILLGAIYRRQQG